MKLRWPDIEVAGINLARMNLRQRIAGTMLALVTAAGLILVISTIVANRRLEQNVTYDLLSEELSHYQQRLHADPGTEPLHSAQLNIYRSRDLAELPAVIARYSPGRYGPVRVNNHYLRVLVRDTEFGRLYITYDITTQLLYQRIVASVLTFGLIVTLILTAWLAYALSGRLVDPIKRLALRLSHINPGQRQLRIGSEFHGNELEPIANSVDTFLERLDGFVEREQSFTATASHELRTPLAVIQGAVELLTDQYAGKPHSQKALSRIQRAIREMADFTDALLLLSREEGKASNSDNICDLHTLITRVVEDQQTTAPAQSLQLEHGTVPATVSAPDSMVTMVVSNIIRNALQHSDGKPVHCYLEGGEFTVSNYGQLAAAQLEHLFERGYTTRSGGHGMGLYLAQRICDRYGWRITVSNRQEQVEACISFTAHT
ncbi:MAG: sensor histidine kinase [Steroidobacteraceae bacterium]